MEAEAKGYMHDMHKQLDELVEHEVQLIGVYGTEQKNMAALTNKVTVIGTILPYSLGQ